MKPDDVFAASRLLQKRARLVAASVNCASANNTFSLVVQHLVGDRGPVMDLESDEMEILTSALIERIDALLENLGVEVPEE